MLAFKRCSLFGHITDIQPHLGGTSCIVTFFRYILYSHIREKLPVDYSVKPLTSLHYHIKDFALLHRVNKSVSRYFHYHIQHINLDPGLVTMISDK